MLGFTGLSLHVRCIPHQQFDKTFLSKCVCCVSYAVLCVSVCSCVREHAATCCHAVWATQAETATDMHASYRSAQQTLSAPRATSSCICLHWSTSFFANQTVASHLCTWPFPRPFAVQLRSFGPKPFAAMQSFQDLEGSFPRPDRIFSKPLALQVPASRHLEWRSLWTSILLQELASHREGFFLGQAILLQGFPDLANQGLIVRAHFFSDSQNQVHPATFHHPTDIRPGVVFFWDPLAWA